MDCDSPHKLFQIPKSPRVAVACFSLTPCSRRTDLVKEHPLDVHHARSTLLDLSWDSDKQRPGREDHRMAAALVGGVKDGPLGSSTALAGRSNGDLSFDPAVFKAYLQALLSPGEIASMQDWRDQG